MRHEVTTRIDAPADLVWRTISDVERWPEWTPTMESVRRLDDGELRVGSVAEVRQPRQPQRTWTVTEHAPGKSFTWTTTGQGVRLSADHVVTARANGEVVVMLSFSVAGPLRFLAALLGGRAIRQAIDTEAASLKSWCESHKPVE
jgi:uncharacterized membrane protein